MGDVVPERCEQMFPELSDAQIARVHRALRSDRRDGRRPVEIRSTSGQVAPGSRTNVSKNPGPGYHADSAGPHQASEVSDLRYISFDGGLREIGARGLRS